MAQSRQQTAEAGDRRGGHLREVGADDGPRQSDVAAELYQARVRGGVELAVVANELRIHYEQLLALEEGRFDDLPGPTYVIGFLRSYAGYLKLDADDVVRRFKDETAYQGPRPDLTFPSPQDEGRVPTGALIVLGLALVGAAYGGWYYMVSADRVALEKVPAVPEHMIVEAAPQGDVSARVETPAEPAPTERIAAPSDEPEVPATVATAAIDVAEANPDAPPDIVPETVLATPDTVANITEPEPVPVTEATAPAAEVAVVEPALMAPEPVAVVVEVPTAAEIAEPAIVVVEAPEVTEPEPADVEAAAVVETIGIEPEPESQPTASLMPDAPVIEGDAYVPREFGLANAGSIIRLRAQLESWIQITGADNELLVTRILRPGDIYHVPDRPNLVLMTGNAGGIEILVGDRVAPSLGAIGAIQRRVALDPDKLLAGTAAD